MFVGKKLAYATLKPTVSLSKNAVGKKESHLFSPFFSVYQHQL